MANVGARKLDRDVVEVISRQLLESFAGSNRNFAKTVVLELLGEEERRMLAKRLAAVCMLIDEQSYYRIHQVLGMSTSTIKTLHKHLLAGNYAQLEKQLLHKKERANLRAQVGLLLRGGLPPRAYVIKKRSIRRLERSM